MRRGVAMSLEEQIHYLLNRPHNPKTEKIPPGWEDEDMDHDSWMEVMKMAADDWKKSQSNLAMA